LLQTPRHITTAVAAVAAPIIATYPIPMV